MKKLLLFLCAMALVFGMVTNASAVPVQFTYTADNVINAWYKDGSSPVSLGLGPNAANWQNADTDTIDLEIGDTYQIIWQTENLEPFPKGANNPGGFLAEISSSTPLIVNSLLSSSAWDVALVGNLDTPTDFDTLTWVAATEYAPNNGPSIWYTANGGPVSGIDVNAQWIWTAANYGDTDAPGQGDSVFIRVSVAPVPEPATMLLLGSGLIGLAIFGRKKLFKKA